MKKNWQQAVNKKVIDISYIRIKVKGIYFNLNIK